MKNTLFKKGLAIWIIILFIGISVIPSNANVLNVNISTDDKVFSIPMDIRGILYVDDDNTGGPWDGTLEHPYQYIQDGVDNAVEGDTIYVFNGIYYEHIVIDKSSIKLIGEDKDITIIDGNGKGSVILINIYFNYTQICNFTIRNGINGIECFSNYNKFYNNIIRDCFIGILITDYCDETWDAVRGSYNEVYNNIIKENYRYGISNEVWYPIFFKKSCNKYYENIISHNNNGINLFNCNHCEVLRNYIHNNTITGIIIGGVSNIIKNNDIRNSVTGILLEGSDLGKVERNNFINNIQNEYFIQYLLDLPTQWKRNYWDDWEGSGPQLIFGILKILAPDYNYYGGYIAYTKITIDLFPARQPYDIPDTSLIRNCGIK